VKAVGALRRNVWAVAGGIGAVFSLRIAGHEVVQSKKQGGYSLQEGAIQKEEKK